MSERRGRTDAEREAARLERERRRVERERTVGAAEPATVSAASGEGLSESGGGVAEPGGGMAEPGEGVAEPGEGVAEPGEGVAEPGGKLAEPGGELAEPGEGLAESGESLAEPGEAPAGTRRVSGIPRSFRAKPGPSAAVKSAATERPKSGALPRARRRPGRTGGTHSRIGRALSLVALVVGGALVWFLAQLFQPFHGSGHGSVTVTIPANSSSSRVGDLLERDGVVASSFFFELRATLAGERGSLRPGTYHLKLDMSYGSALDLLTTPPKAARVTPLTITEGRTRRQIDALLRNQGVPGSYLAATRRSRLLDPLRYGAPRSTSSLEGFLFPSTYQLRDPIAISALVADQLRTFRQRFASVNLGYARSKRLTQYDVLIIASMVEAEAQTTRDRPLIASVIYNRLAAGMPLQIDATTRYATGNYTSPLTVSQLNSSSPYNTRINKGLTPTPIDNPGLASIEAAAHPARTGYLYFVVKPCGNGEQSFASTYKQFLAYAQQYQAARAKRGGRSPTRC